jgi:hypothetical protein
MSQTVEVVKDERCGSCAARGDVLSVTQMSTPSSGRESKFCNACFRDLSVKADKAIGDFSNREQRWPSTIPFVLAMLLFAAAAHAQHYQSATVHSNAQFRDMPYTDVDGSALTVKGSDGATYGCTFVNGQCNLAAAPGAYWLFDDIGHQSAIFTATAGAFGIPNHSDGSILSVTAADAKTYTCIFAGGQCTLTTPPGVWWYMIDVGTVFRTTLTTDPKAAPPPPSARRGRASVAPAAPFVAAAHYSDSGSCCDLFAMPPTKDLIPGRDILVRSSDGLRWRVYAAQFVGLSCCNVPAGWTQVWPTP